MIIVQKLHQNWRETKVKYLKFPLLGLIYVKNHKLHNNAMHISDRVLLYI